jgi:hypothetical protein
MTMVDEDAVHRAQRRRAQRRKKLAVGVAGLAAILAGGGYAVSVYQAARDATIIGGDTGALGPPPAVSPAATTSAPPAASPSGSASPSGRSSPSSRPPSTRLSAARQLSRPSPTPTPSPLADEQAAGAQVSRLLPAPANASGGPAAAGRSAVVANETGADGSAIRIVSGRHDLRTRLWAADAGVQVGDARCTQNLRIDGRAAEVRPRMLLCWRVSAARSVVTVATNATGKPSTATSVRVIERVWQQLG